jgi:Tat protein secretion system quality control protein TatD with DNase activity
VWEPTPTPPNFPTPAHGILRHNKQTTQGPEKDVRNEPATVPIGVATMAQVKGISEAEAMMAIRDNFRQLFGR